MNVESHSPDGVPLLVYIPAHEPRALVIHVPAFGQTKEIADPILRRLVGAGYVAMAIDAYQHGARGCESLEDLAARVFRNFRREMWTIIGETAFDLPRVASWARRRFGAFPIHLTGLSMGGDAIVAAAPMLDDVASVDAVIATPDWTRPGMCDMQTGKAIAQGKPDAKARLFYDALDPLTHADRYGNAPVHFIVGSADTHVPPDGAYRFQERLAGLGRGDIVRITQCPGKSHADFGDPESWLGHLSFIRAADR